MLPDKALTRSSARRARLDSKRRFTGGAAFVGSEACAWHTAVVPDDAPPIFFLHAYNDPVSASAFPSINAASKFTFAESNSV